MIFAHNLTILENWLRTRGDISDPEAAIARIHALELDHGKTVMVDLQLPYDLIGCAQSMHRATEVQLMAVARIEAATGRTLTVRTQS